MKKQYAAIDLGSNSCRLSIADENGEIFFKDHSPTKLAEGLFASGKLSDEAIDRALETFSRFAEEIHQHKVEADNIRAVATAACRMASNTAVLQEQVKRNTGINIEVIDEKEEAKLNLLGGMKNIIGKSEYVVLYDLGGASTEITLATNKLNPDIIHTISIPWGARNAAEAFDTAEYNAEKGQKLSDEVKKYVDDFVKKSDLKNRKDVLFVATSSTPLRLSSLVYNDELYDREFCDGRVINCKDADNVIGKILRCKPEEMAQDERIGENRAPIFSAACIIFQTIYHELGAKELISSLASAQDGIIQQFLERDNGKTNKISKTGSRQTYAGR